MVLQEVVPILDSVATEGQARKDTLSSFEETPLHLPLAPISPQCLTLSN